MESSLETLDSDGVAQFKIVLITVNITKDVNTPIEETLVWQQPADAMGIGELVDGDDPIF